MGWLILLFIQMLSPTVVSVETGSSWGEGAQRQSGRRGHSPALRNLLTLGSTSPCHLPP